MKIPLAVQAAAALELRKRRGEKVDELHVPGTSRFIGMKRYCELVTPNWTWTWPHLLHIDKVLDKVMSGELKRVIIELPTRIGKTEKVNVRFPAAYLELNPDAPIILGGYNEKFAMRLSRKVLRIVKTRVAMSPRYSAGDWETAAGGGIRAAGVGVGVAGLPAKLILIDDPVKNREDAYSQAHRDKVWEWYTEDMYTRLEPDGAIVITMARRHEDDLVGRILASDDADSWTVVRLPALAEEDDPLGRQPGEALCPARFDEKAYARMRLVMGEVSFSALQQQRPTPASGLIFQSAQIRYYTTPEKPLQEKDGSFVPTINPQQRWDEIFQSWDMSFKDEMASDYVAGHVWARKGADAVFLDRRSERWSFNDTIKQVRILSQRWPKALLKLIENKANGPAVISALRSELGGFRSVDAQEDKVSRAWAVTPLFEGGNVWFPHPKIAPWVPKVVLQMVQFPYGAHDDDVDALTQALNKIRKKLEQIQREAEHRHRRGRTRSMRILR